MNIYKKLNQFIETMKNEPFKWGVNDCCMFANRYMMEVHGVDFMKEFRGKYDSQETALVALRTHGKGSLIATMKEKFGQQKHISRTMRGDIVLFIDRENGPSLGVCVGKYSFFTGEEGLTPLLTKDCVASWGR